MKKHKMNRKASKQLFSKTASKIHPRNASVGPRRGGIRL
jgi:hypothetical protein